MDAILPGSIKAKILEAIAELGHAATSAAIRKRHPSDEAIVNMALDQLTAAALIEITSEGNYKLSDAAKKAARGQSIDSAIVAIASQRKQAVTFEQLAGAPKPATPVPPRPRTQPAERVATIEQPAPKSFSPTPAPAPGPAPQAPPLPAGLDKPAPPAVSPPLVPSPPSPPPPALSTPPPPITTQEPAVASLIKCNECNKPKPKDEYYIVNGEPLKKCKRCVLDAQKARKLEREKRAAAPKAKRAAKSAVASRSSAAAADLIIPAGGEIRCRTDGHSYEIRQYDALIVCSPDQLQAIRDWASGQLKARAER
jgi:hypothetical protein